MPIHDWTRVESGTFHDFHQDWTVQICRMLNAGLLPYERFATVPLPENVFEGEDETSSYARKANRIVVRHHLGRVVALIEVMSPGNKDSANALRSFVAKAVDFLRHGIHLLIVDLFPPTPRDPTGIHQVIWNELTDLPFEARPADKPLTVAAYDAREDLTAYVEPLAVGDALPDAPLFLEPGLWVPTPLEASYQRSWSLLPSIIRELVEPSPTADGVT